MIWSYRVSVDKYERNSVLTVRKAVRADSGKYKIILKNSSGTCEGEADVVVLGKRFHYLRILFGIQFRFYFIGYFKTTHLLVDKPSRPSGPIVPEEIRADHIKIKWKKPEDAGGSPLTGYIIEKMDLDTGRWVAAGEVGPNDETFTASGLTPKKKYKFRVKAVNKEGESEALETEEPIMARNPYGKSLHR